MTRELEFKLRGCIGSFSACLQELTLTHTTPTLDTWGSRSHVAFGPFLHGMTLSH